jgi:phosphatidylinositol dimannoside acyltransferase
MRRAEWVDAYLMSIVLLMRFVAWTGSARLRGMFAGVAGNAAYQSARQKRKLVQARVAEFLGEERNTPRTARIVHETFQTFWEDIFRLALPERDLGRVRVSGLEHIGAALVQGHGAILLENSLFGQRHLATQVLFARGISVHQVHQSTHLGGLSAPGETEARVRLIQPYLEEREKRFVEEIICLYENNSLAFTRRLAEVLQRNQVLCLSGEGQFSARPIWLTFLGFQRKFATGAISLARMTGAPVLPMYCWREASDHMQLRIEPPLTLQAGMQSYVEQLEMYVRRNPGQYRGWHRED